MTKIIRVLAVLLLVFTAIISAQAAFSSFYGIKNGDLVSNVWGQSSSVNGTDSTDGSTDGSSSTDALLGNEMTSGCDYTTELHVSVTQNTTFSGTVKLGLTGDVITSITAGANTGSWSSSQNVVFVHHGSQVTCPGYNGLCSTVPCYIPVGSVPYAVVGSAGTNILISTN